MSLIGKIGENGKGFFIGSNFERTVDTSGQLFLVMNDANYESAYDDNMGFYTAQITVTD